MQNIFSYKAFMHFYVQRKLGITEPVANLYRTYYQENKGASLEIMENLLFLK